MTKQRFSLLLLSLPLVLNCWGQTAGPSSEAAQAGVAPPGCPMILDSLFAIADRNSQQLRISMTGAASSGEALKAAKSNMLPDVNLSLSGSYIGTATVLSRGFSSSGQTTVPYAIGVGQVQNGPQPTPHWGNDFVAQVSQVIYAGGGIKAGIRMAELGEQLTLTHINPSQLDFGALMATYVQSMMNVAIKQVYGIIIWISGLMAAVFFLLDIPAVRTNVRKVPLWAVYGIEYLSRHVRNR